MRLGGASGCAGSLKHRDSVATYQKPLEEAEGAIDQFEATVFGEHEFTGLLRRIYLVKRRVTLMRRVLMGMNPVQAMEALVAQMGKTPSNTALLDRMSITAGR